MAKKHQKRSKSSASAKAKSTPLPPSPPASEHSVPATSTSPNDDNGVSFPTSIHNFPLATQRRQPAAADRISKPAIRANRAVSSEAPEGSPESQESPMKNHTVLQQHVLFWDRDRDGEIYPWDTYVGFRDLGFSIIFSVLAAVVVNGAFSYPTRLAVSYWPDLLRWRIYVGGIHKAKHGSDSGVYDREGRFVPQAFEHMFSEWDEHDSGSLSAGELWRMIAGHRVTVDPFGWGAAFLEWATTWVLLQEHGRVSKEDLRRTYDGTIFWKIKEARDQGKGWNKGFGLRDMLGLGVRQVKQRIM